MIPKKLRLQNFLSYGERVQELDFDSFQLAALTGENGAGKTSLIEAIPFCIWGEGREKKEQLIRRGASEARVELEFELGTSIYQIKRFLKRTKQGASQELEFSIYDLHTNDFRTLTEGTLRETQNEIIKRIGIQYETFANSAFIQQGKADEFTRQTATKRKEILSEILGLEHYQLLSQKAKTKADLKTAQLQNAVTRIELLNAELLNLPQLEISLSARQAEEIELKNSLTSKKTLLENAQLALQSLNEQEASLQSVLEREKDINSQIKQIQTQLTSKEFDLSNQKAILSRKKIIEDAAREFEQLQNELESFEKKQQESQLIQNEITSLENKFNIYRSTLESQLKSEQAALERHFKMIEQKKEKLNRRPELHSRLMVLNNHLQSSTLTIEELTKLESEIDSDDSLMKMKAKLQILIEKKEDITTKGKTIKNLTDSNCPLCKSPIDESHRAHILESYRDEMRYLIKQQTEVEKEIGVHDEVKKQRQVKLSQLKKQVKEHSEYALELQRVRSELQQLDGFESEVEELVAEKKVYEKTINSIKNSLESILRPNDDIERLKQNLQAIDYQEKKHQELRQKLKNTRQIQTELANLTNAEKRASLLSTEIENLKHSLNRSYETLTIISEQTNTLKLNLATKPNAQQALDLLRKETATIENELRDHSAHVKSLELSREILIKKKQTLDELQQSIKSDTELVELYKILQESYGVKGIQLMLIEKACPEIERLANELLTDLSKNQFSLTIETEREAKARDGTIQTLEIIISDANGESRPYETFSGGERFRIDFSLRIALSQFLANQSGTPIKMLVIDEGFGTQDEDGLEALIDAMNQVSEKFEKLILITHLDRLKDQFPTRIVVRKDASLGSVFELVG